MRSNKVKFAYINQAMTKSKNATFTEDSKGGITIKYNKNKVK